MLNLSFKPNVYDHTKTLNEIIEEFKHKKAWEDAT